MARHIPSPTRIAAAGNLPKVIEEYVGRVNSGTGSVSIARMTSPAGWTELRVRSRDGVLDVRAGEAVIVPAGEWVQYGSPGEDGAEYLAVCVPAFSPETVHRDE
jgi:mannose-6-phosphate isomerase-like protein (cupin superfamily)